MIQVCAEFLATMDHYSDVIPPIEAAYFSLQMALYVGAYWSKQLVNRIKKEAYKI